jgi:MFS family permease
MYTFMLFLHVVGAVGMGVYAIMPFVAALFNKISGPAQAGLAGGLYIGGRIGQFSLIIQLLTGGYIMSKADYAMSWIIVMLVVFIAIGAFTGIVQRPLKEIRKASDEGRDASGAIRKVQSMSVIILILFLGILWLMQAPWYA